MTRVFVGSFLEGEEREILARFLAEENEKLKPDQVSSIRSVKPEKLHITWQFLGELNQNELLNLKEKLLALEGPLSESAKFPFSITYDYAEAWPSTQARVIVARPRVESETLTALAKLLREALAPHSRADAAVERNIVFKPHVTLYRLRQACDEAVAAIISDFQPFEQTISAIHLVESHLQCMQEGSYASTYRSLLQLSPSNAGAVSKAPYQDLLN
ncbi:MAG: RNA 2',3'-cyclic phosphodiesterase [Candidatus Melainabacteria bacterium]|nr:RNA 2',3'-cyclic phosphodiesterase [Candidatus Melainabacteria bacterium]